MHAEWMMTAFVIVDELLSRAGHHGHPLAQATDAEVLTVAIASAKYFQSHHERAVVLMQQTGYLSGPLSVSRFNRLLHQLGDYLELALATLGEVAAHGAAFIIESLPVPTPASASGRVGAARRPAVITAATARPRARSSSAGACI